MMEEGLSWPERSDRTIVGLQGKSKLKSLIREKLSEICLVTLNSIFRLSKNPKLLLLRALFEIN
jgi:hypothetical protein